MLAALLANLPAPAPTPTIPFADGGVRRVRNYDKERERLSIRQQREDDEIFSVLMALIETDII